MLWPGPTVGLITCTYTALAYCYALLIMTFVDCPRCIIYRRIHSTPRIPAPLALVPGLSSISTDEFYSSSNPKHYLPPHPEFYYHHLQTNEGLQFPSPLTSFFSLLPSYYLPFPSYHLLRINHPSFRKLAAAPSSCGR